jgi:hypothetical protein
MVPIQCRRAMRILRTRTPVDVKPYIGRWNV